MGYENRWVKDYHEVKTKSVITRIVRVYPEIYSNYSKEEGRRSRLEHWFNFYIFGNYFDSL